MSISNELDKLDELHRRGALSDDEFARAKARVLGGSDQPATSAPAIGAINQFRRSRNDRWLGGVCGGLAQITGLAAWAWRLIFTLLFLCAGSGAVIYLLLWLFVPEQELALGPSALNPSETPAGQR
jgi:phage shock protein PspC (stress-responsive transcriptional regulator)